MCKSPVAVWHGGGGSLKTFPPGSASTIGITGGGGITEKERTCLGLRPGSWREIKVQLRVPCCLTSACTRSSSTRVHLVAIRLRLEEFMKAKAAAAAASLESLPPTTVPSNEDKSPVSPAIAPCVNIYVYRVDRGWLGPAQDSY